MPIGNQEIWDKGIGAGATNVVFGGGDTQPSSTNFNPGALGADPTQKPADPAAPAAPATPGTPTTPTTPVEPVSTLTEQQRMLLQSQLRSAQFNLQEAMRQYQEANSTQHFKAASRAKSRILSLQNQIAQLQNSLSK